MTASPAESPARDDAVHAESVRIARRLAARDDLKIIGFVPCADHVDVAPAAHELATALIELTGGTVALVQPRQPEPATRWVTSSLAVLSPAASARAGEVLPALARLLVERVDLFRYVLVDLTGFDLLGEHASAAACMDGVVVVGSAHRTRERHIVRYAEEMPPERFIGVLLVG